MAESTANTTTTNGTGRTVIDDGVIAKVAGIAAREVPGVHALGNGAARALGAIRGALGNSQVRVRTAGRSLFLSGTTANADDARRAEMIARGLGNEDTEILNEISVLSSIQVNLRVRVAEISRILDPLLRRRDANA